jgi:uncharacterized protein YkwD
MGRSRSWAAAVVVLVLCATLAVAAIGSANARTLRRVQMLHKMNSARIDHGTRRLSMSKRLVHSAKQHSRSMASKGYIFHTRSLSDTLRGMTWRIAGENVGSGDSVDSLFKAFMHSTEHRRNILRSSFRHTGVGMVRRGGYLWVTIIFYG